MGRRTRDRPDTRETRSRQPDVTPDREDGTTSRELLDPLTSVDDLLREMVAELDELNTRLSREEPTVPDTPDVGPGVGGGGSGPAPDAPPIYPYDFSRVVPADTPATDPVTSEFVAPSDGRVRRVVLGWPLGTQQAAGIGITGPDGESLIPRGPRDANFVAFDDETIEYNLNESLQDADTVEIALVNNDAQDHFLNVGVFFQEVADAN